MKEAYWNDVFGWGTEKEADNHIRRDRTGRQEGRFAHYLREQMECTEFCLEMDDELSKGLWVRN